MEKKSIQELEKIYDIDIDEIVKKIKKVRAKKILLQFPDGLKPYANVITNEIEKNCRCECMIWLDSCFGACDLPLQVEKIGVDLVVQFGHSAWKFKNKGIKVISH
jgi:2-(3-amino-3-carboxypropyl)histidine synthase